MLLRLLLISLATCLCTVARSQKGGYRLDFDWQEHNFVDSVTIDYEHHQVFVPVTIGGRSYRFLLDTGAGQAVVYDDVPIRGCDSIGVIASRDAIGHVDTVRLLRLPPMTIGKTVLTGCRATLQHRAVKRPGVDGIVGFSLVNKGLLMKIDVNRHLLVLTDRKKFFDREDGFVLKYKLDYHVPYVTIEPFSGYRERVLFDTGSRKFYAMNLASFEKALPACMSQNPQQIEGRSYGRHAIGLHGLEPFGPVAFLAIDGLRWGKFSFCDVHTTTTRGGSHLGGYLLEFGAIVFNPRRKHVMLQPYVNGDRCYVSNEQLQRAIVNEHGRPVVGLVWERSDFYKAGIRQGDQILKADEKTFDSFADFAAFRPVIGHTYKVLVRDRRGFIKEVMLQFL